MEQMEYRRETGLVTNEERQMGMFLHLSQLANLIIPLAGIIIPIVLWQSNKESMPGLDRHGKMVVNWMISSLIYFFVAFILAFVLIGFLLIPVIALMGIIFPIIGGIKANNGEDWDYPATIKFLK